MSELLDAAVRQRRELVSAVKRLRVAATSDPARGDELADALVRLTGERMLAWAFAEAATEAPESVLLAARTLAQRGAAGPYTSIPDAVRFFSASAQLAAVQAELGQAEGGGRTIDGLEGWRRQLGRLPLVEHLPDESVVWALLARARALLETDVPAANAHADAAGVRLYAAGLDEEPRAAYLAVAVHLLLADCRWAGGLPEAALAHHHLAIAGHRSVLPKRASRPAVVAVVLAPVAVLHETYAARLTASGDVPGGIAVRRTQVRLLERFDDPERLAVARCHLAHALGRAGRGVEADAELAEAQALARRVGVGLAEPAPIAPPGARVGWEPLPATETWRSGEDPGTAAARLQRDEQAAVFAGAAARAEAERDEARLQAEAEHSAALRAVELAEAERLAAAQAAAAEAALAEQEQLAVEEARLKRAAEDAAARAAAEDRRRELAEARQPAPGVDPETAAAAEAELAVARTAVRAAGEDLVGSAVATEQLAGLLRPLAALAPSDYGPELLATLEGLVGLRWRLGDPDGSREASREAKSLATELGR